MTPLLAAAALGNFEIAELLLKAGVDLNIPNKDGVTSQYMVIQNGHHEVVKKLEVALKEQKLKGNKYLLRQNKSLRY